MPTENVAARRTDLEPSVPTGFSELPFLLYERLIGNWGTVEKYLRHLQGQNKIGNARTQWLNTPTILIASQKAAEGLTVNQTAEFLSMPVHTVYKCRGRGLWAIKRSVCQYNLFESFCAHLKTQSGKDLATITDIWHSKSASPLNARQEEMIDGFIQFEKYISSSKQSKTLPHVSTFLYLLSQGYDVVDIRQMYGIVWPRSVDNARNSIRKLALSEGAENEYVNTLSQDLVLARFMKNNFWLNDREAVAFGIDRIMTLLIPKIFAEHNDVNQQVRSLYEDVRAYYRMSLLLSLDPGLHRITDHYYPDVFGALPEVAQFRKDPISKKSTQILEAFYKHHYEVYKELPFGFRFLLFPESSVSAQRFIHNWIEKYHFLGWNDATITSDRASIKRFILNVSLTLGSPNVDISTVDVSSLAAIHVEETQKYIAGLQDFISQKNHSNQINYQPLIG